MENPFDNYASIFLQFICCIIFKMGSNTEKVTPKVLFATLAKDVVEYCDTIKSSFDLFQRLMTDAKIVIFENNSVDGTKDFLKKWSSNNSNVHVEMQDYDEEFFRKLCVGRDIYNNPSRPECNAWARNKLMDIVDSPEYDEITHIVMFDFNTMHPLPIQNIYNTLTKMDKEYDAIICNAIDANGCAVDAYSMRTMEHMFGPEIMGDMFWHESHIRALKRNFGYKDELIPVLSAFNGLCIFKKESIRGVRYSGVPTTAMDTFYRLECDNFVLKSNTLYAGIPLGVYCFPNKTLFYSNNSGYNYPVVNPHTSFFLEMRKNGKDKVFVYPKFLWRKYTHVL